MGCSLVEEVLDLVAHLADCRRLSSAVAVVFELVSIGNGTGGKTEKKKKKTGKNGWGCYILLNRLFNNQILPLSLICNCALHFST